MWNSLPEWLRGWRTPLFALTFVLYLLLAFTAYPWMGRGMGALSVFLVLVAALCWGRSVSIGIALLVIPLNTLLFNLLEPGVGLSVILDEGYLFLYLLQIFIGGFVGQMQMIIQSRQREIERRTVAEAEQARLIVQMQDALDRLQALYQAIQTVHSTREVGPLLQRVVESAQQAVRADRAYLIIIEVDERRVTHYLHCGPASRDVAPLSYDELSEGLSGWVLREQKPALSPKGASDPRESEAVRRRRKATHSGSIIVVPISQNGRAFGTLTVLNRPEQRDFDAADVDLLMAMGYQVAIAIEQARLLEEVQTLARLDPLTALLNRRGFLLLAEQAVRYAARYHKALGALLIDIDHFKAVNDQWGHAVGDQVLVELAGRFQEGMRQADILARLGGEEFVILLPESSSAGLRQVGERLRQAVADRPFVTAVGTLTITISVGAALLDPGVDELDSLLARADRALYRAKALGRDRLVLVQEDDRPGGLLEKSCAH